jgi:hypothetical protein
VRSRATTDFITDADDVFPDDDFFPDVDDLFDNIGNGHATAPAPTQYVLLSPVFMFMF